MNESKGTVCGEYACIPHLRYRKAIQVPLNPRDLYDDHERLDIMQEYPRWLRKPGSTYTPYIECMDYEFEVKPDGTDRSTVRLWAVPNQFSQEHRAVILKEWTIVKELLLDPPFDLLLRKTMNRIVKPGSAPLPAPQPY